MNTTSLPAIRGFGAVLGNRPFLALWLAQVFSQVADKIYFILMVDVVTARTFNNGTWTSAALVAYTVPSVLFGAFAGALVDRWDKVRTQIATNMLRGGLIALVPILAPEAAWPIIILSFLISTFSQPYTPAEAATIPLVVPQPNLMTANSLFATTVVGSIILGFTVGEPYILLAGGVDGPWAAWSISALYLVSSLALLAVRTPPQPRREHPLSELFEEFRTAWDYIRGYRPVWSAIARLVVLFAMFAALSTLAILFAKQDLGTNFSWLLATAGIGMACGAAVIGKWGHDWNRARMFNTGFVGAGVALLLLAAVGSAPWREAFGWAGEAGPGLPFAGVMLDKRFVTAFSYVLTGVVGFASAWVAIPNQTLLQEVVPEDRRGKVFGVQNMATNIATTLPMGGIGIMSDLWGVRTLIALLGVVMLVSSLGSRAWLWVPGIKRS
ncbi:MAG: MFS transporter [Candidatus Sericytochromatia bacterium]|nr:MFS transporter [Candidatus Tanganyikabacteria bacterium]